MLPSSEVFKDVLTPSVESDDDVLPVASDNISLTVDALCGDFTGICIIHHNIQGLHSKLDDLSEWFSLGAGKGTIFCFGEIWMNSCDPSVSVPGFQLFISPYHFHPDTRSRSLLPGSCMFISSVLTVYRPSVCIKIENSCQLLNVTCCLVCCKDSYLAVACIYRCLTRLQHQHSWAVHIVKNLRKFDHISPVTLNLGGYLWALLFATVLCIPCISFIIKHLIYWIHL